MMGHLSAQHKRVRGTLFFLLNIEGNRVAGGYTVCSLNIEGKKSVCVWVGGGGGA